MKVEMDSMTNEPPFLPVLPELPTFLTLQDGKQYDVSGDVWSFTQGGGIKLSVKFNWTLLANIVVAGTSTRVMSERAVTLVKLYVLERLDTGGDSIKPLTGKRCEYAMVAFARFLAAYPMWMPAGRSFDWSDLSAEILDAWLTLENQKKQKREYAGLVRQFYLWGADPAAGRPDFSTDLASELSAIRIKRHARGELVESRDIKRGPFNREELELMFSACATGKGEAQDRAIVLTLLETAMRPKQLYLLTNQDLEVSKGVSEVDDADGTLTEVSYRLRVRKIKLRRNVIKYHVLPLSACCGKLLNDLRKPGSNADDPLLWWINSSFWDSITTRLKAFSEDADLRSPRIPIEYPEDEGPTHERLHLTPRRFRYAVATDRIAYGDSPTDVADMLGHKSKKDVGVYIETSPWIADYFQKATDYAIRPLVAMMEGRAKPSEMNLLADIAPPVAPQLRIYTDAPLFMGDSGSHSHSNNQRMNMPSAMPVRPATKPGKSEAKIKDLVARARRKFPLIYPGQDFDAQLWKVVHLRERQNVNQVVSFGFTTRDSTVSTRLSTRPEDALPPYFAAVVKSWMVISNEVTVATNADRLYAARNFWHFLATRQGGNAASFRWGDLCESDMRAFEQFLMSSESNRKQSLGPGSVLKIIQKMQRLVDFLASHGICRRIDYIPQTQAPRLAATRQLEAKRLAAEMKLPAPGVLDTLASIYHRLTTAPEGEVSDWVLIFISGVAILMLTGLRIGELVTLPYDCEVEEKRPKADPGELDSYWYGIKYWVEKRGRKTMRIKWISPTAEPIVRASIVRVKRLTAAARERARVLEADPMRVPLPPELESRSTLSGPELRAIIGQKDKKRVHDDPQGLLPQHGSCRWTHYYVKDLGPYLLSRRVTELYTIRHDDGTVQKLSESLFIIFAKQSRKTRGGTLSSSGRAGEVASVLDVFVITSHYLQGLWKRRVAEGVICKPAQFPPLADAYCL
ncbi:MAG TPA: tyrosine-type recombinase/integrase [Pyrinomonadaceae bacterium]|jgi:integrase